MYYCFILLYSQLLIQNIFKCVTKTFIFGAIMYIIQTGFYNNQSCSISSLNQENVQYLSSKYRQTNLNLFCHLINFFHIYKINFSTFPINI